uniref:Reverse transcriptase zinc-binding domain-containing protein n=1 Tax=Triticum urartu TaxID=4572 RepID=A0A8R7RD01_TRIUA
MQVADMRTTRGAEKPFTAKLAYHAVWRTKPTDTLAPAIWRNYAPNKCRLCLWLARKDRLFMNERRFRRGIATSAACPFCDHCESINHLLFECQHLAPLWGELDSLCPSAPQGLLQAWEGEWHNKTRSTILMSVLWNIWKRRNAKVFRNIHLGLHDAASSSAEDLKLWSHRCNNIQKQIQLRDWGSMLFHLAGRI